MKNNFRVIMFLLMLSGCTLAPTKNEVVRNPSAEVAGGALAQLDSLKTCDNDSKIKNAQVALKWIAAYNDRSAKNFTDIKTQTCLFAPGYSVWHGSLAGLAAASKGTAAFANLPFPTGQLNEKNYAQSIAFIAYANDMSKNVVTPKRVDCVQDSTVVVELSFSGFQVKRDGDGYITHGVDYSAPTTKIFTFNNDHQITQQHVILDSGASIAARKSLAELVAKNSTALPRDELTRGTLPQIAAALQNDLAGNSCR